MLWEMHHVKWAQWKMNENVKWEDVHTSYFHAMVVQRCQRNKITQILSDCGIIEGHKQIGQTSVNYFS